MVFIPFLFPITASTQPVAKYVEPGGSCGTYAPCYTTISDGLDPSEDKAIIKIASGLYQENVSVNLTVPTQELELQGGWNDTFEKDPSERILKTKIVGQLILQSGVTTVSGLIIAPSVQAPLGSHYDKLETYEGSKSCLDCHFDTVEHDEVREVINSVHYQWKGNASETVGLTDAVAGKMDGINDFCIYPNINWIGMLDTVYGEKAAGGCAKCHVGLGAKPRNDVSPVQAQLENVDCLVCHSDYYERTVDEVDGSYRFVPNTNKMTVDPLTAARNVGDPSDDNCLDCHISAGGGKNFKRGDIEEGHRTPAFDFDIHMAPVAEGGAGKRCIDCHKVTAHRFAGRGSDLRPRESPTEISCSTAACHPSFLHGTEYLDNHLDKVNCTVCHIPYFAKVNPTDMERNWSEPGELVKATGLYEPHNIRQSMVIPEYLFFNGTSYFYQFGSAAVAGANGRVLMSGPMGGIDDAGSKLYAFKHHIGHQPIDPITNYLLPLKIGKFFETGQIDEAVQLGVQAVGWSYNGHSFAVTERYMGLYHEVSPKEEALACGDCHYGGTRIDFDQLGYTPKQTYGSVTLCAGCHEDKTGHWPANELFDEVHDEHDEEPCSECHYFSR
jgi:hypothetical protein